MKTVETLNGNYVKEIIVRLAIRKTATYFHLGLWYYNKCHLWLPHITINFIPRCSK